MKVERYFQQRADEFDALYEEGHRWQYYLNRLLRRGLYDRVQLTIRQMEDLQGFTVLDVGCGSGRNSVLFVEAGARRMVGIDLSERMIKLATEFSRAWGVASQCKFIRADFLAYPFEQKFDVVVALGVFDYVSDPQRFLQRMVEVAKVKVIVSFPRISVVRATMRKIRYALRGCPLYFYSTRQLDQMCEDIGLMNYCLMPYASSGLLLVGRVDAK